MSRRSFLATARQATFVRNNKMPGDYMGGDDMARFAASQNTGLNIQPVSFDYTPVAARGAEPSEHVNRRHGPLIPGHIETVAESMLDRIWRQPELLWAAAIFIGSIYWIRTRG